jgi:hypothetical protein
VRQTMKKIWMEAKDNDDHGEMDLGPGRKDDPDTSLNFVCCFSSQIFYVHHFVWRTMFDLFCYFCLCPINLCGKPQRLPSSFSFKNSKMMLVFQIYSLLAFLSKIKFQVNYCSLFVELLKLMVPHYRYSGNKFAQNLFMEIDTRKGRW